MPNTHKDRIDKLIVTKGLISSREKAQRIIMTGLVYADNKKVDKPGTLIDISSNIEIRNKDNPFVSRGGLKLEKALERFDIPIKGRIYLDVGASTGGFTDCLLKYGAKKVFSIDVGYGQLAWELRQDSRVKVMERTNIRMVTRNNLDSLVNGAVVDVSFISLKLVLPIVYDLIEDDSHIISLIKPQFEADKDKVGKNGVVKKPEVHSEVITTILDFCQGINLQILNLSFSPIKGPAGNIEFLLHLYKGLAHKTNITKDNSDFLVDSIVTEAHDSLDKN